MPPPPPNLKVPPNFCVWPSSNSTPPDLIKNDQSQNIAYRGSLQLNSAIKISILVFSRSLRFWKTGGPEREDRVLKIRSGRYSWRYWSKHRARDSEEGKPVAGDIRNENEPQTAKDGSEEGKSIGRSTSKDTDDAEYGNKEEKVKLYHKGVPELIGKKLSGEIICRWEWEQQTGSVCLSCKPWEYARDEIPWKYFS